MHIGIWGFGFMVHLTSENTGLRPPLREGGIFRGQMNHKAKTPEHLSESARMMSGAVPEWKAQGG
jgi:hypothetical protein